MSRLWQPIGVQAESILASLGVEKSVSQSSKMLLATYKDDKSEQNRGWDTYSWSDLELFD